MEAELAEDRCGWTGWGGPRACARDMGFPSKTSVSMRARAVATGVGTSKGLEGKGNS